MGKKSWSDWLDDISHRNDQLTKLDNDIKEAEGALADRIAQQNTPDGSEQREADATAKLHVVLNDIDKIHEELGE